MKNLILFILMLFLITDSYSQTPQTYTSFQGTQLSLYAWQGSKIMLLSGSNALNSITMNNWVTKMDSAYNYYTQCTGRQPVFYNGVTYLNNRSTIAQVPQTCGAGCGYLGWTGIEMQTTYFDNMYNYINTQNLYNQVPFYELGRNFWFYENQLKYKTNDPIVTGYAVFMRFMSMEYAGVQGAPFNSWTFTQFKNNVINLLPAYMADTSLNWNNTLGIGQGVPNSSLGATDLFASFCFYLRDHSCKSRWVENVWKFAGMRPTAVTTQDAVDNFIIASSQAAGSNLVSLFQSWKWPVSSSAIAYINSLNLHACINTTGTVVNATCGAANGSINLTVNGGSGLYQYTWSNGMHTEDLLGIAAGNYSVTVTDFNGTTASASFSVATNVIALPAIPGTIAGSTAICPDSSAYIYSVAAVSNATSYTWTIPSNCSLISGQGTTTITVRFNALYTSGAITVKASNCAGSSNTRSLTVAKMAKPGTPVFMSTSTVICPGSDYDFTVFNVTNATSYLWTVPANAIILSGQGTDDVTIRFLPGYVKANISVKAINCAGVGSARSLAISPMTKPGTPGTITGATSICPGTYTFSISTVRNATNYNWTAPAGASITAGQGTTTASVAFDNSFSGGSLSVTASNCAGASAAKAKTLSRSAICFFGKTDESNIDQEILATDNDADFEVKVYPNPFTDRFIVDSKGSGDEKTEIRIFDIRGQMLRHVEESKQNEVFELGSEITKGIYFVEVRMGEKTKVIKLLKSE